jgi:energy-coupling factor transporter ATP-binding protein EcfA2
MSLRGFMLRSADLSEARLRGVDLTCVVTFALASWVLSATATTAAISAAVGVGVGVATGLARPQTQAKPDGLTSGSDRDDIPRTRNHSPMNRSSPPSLRRVVIRDFRAVDHLEITFPEGDEERAGALVLAGDNGCGKTSVLEAILLLFGRIDLLPADTAAPRELVRQGATDFTIEGHLAKGNKTEAWSVHRAQIEKLEQRLRPTGRDALAFGLPIAREVLSEALRSLHWGGAGPDGFTIESFSARREPEELGEPTSDARGRRTTREERRITELKRRLANVFARSRHNETFDRIERFMRDFLGERWSLDVIFRDVAIGSDPLVVVRDGDVPEGPDGAPSTFEALRARAAHGEPMPRVVPIDRLSSGQMAVLAMTYPFVFGDRPVDLALVDEPEQHLHPAWQRAFLGAMRRLSPATQFIIATHSPQVLDSVASHERLTLLNEDAPPATPLPDAAE